VINGNSDNTMENLKAPQDTSNVRLIEEDVIRPIIETRECNAARPTSRKRTG
jgi:hypothetical protein